MNSQIKHKSFCFAGQPAPCKGHFAGDVLPCICGTEGDVITALSQLALPAAVCGKAAGAAPPKSYSNSPHESMSSWKSEGTASGKNK